MSVAAPTLTATAAELHRALRPARRAGEEVVLVATMGAFHAGHLALLRTARERAGPAGTVAVSIFVNPLQFGPAEDLSDYPRTLDSDLEACAEHGVDVVFAPDVAEVYPDGDPEVTVDPGRLGRVLEGSARPGHLRGVLTVVAKLFGLVRPDRAVFGEKDYQQLVLVRRMAADLCQGVEVVSVPTVREPDGLALSSRNAYLGSGQRRQALALPAALDAAQQVAGRGAAAALDAARAVLQGQSGVQPDYLALADEALEQVVRADLGGHHGERADVGHRDHHGAGPGSGAPAPALDGVLARLLVAARVGPARLIDNTALDLRDRADPE